MYRPNDWEKHFEKPGDPLFREVFELGADAMLLAVKDDMENLLAYAHGNDQCDSEDFNEMDKIAER